jgi:hypothetical protein
MSDHCVFCKIIRKEIPSNVVYEDDQALAFTDIHPAAPVHVLLIPKSHVESVDDIPAGDPMVSMLTERAVKIARQLNLREGYPWSSTTAITADRPSTTCTSTFWAGVSWPGRRVEGEYPFKSPFSPRLTGASGKH